MDFINELNTLRNERIAEINDEINIESLKKFNEYMTTLFTTNNHIVKAALKNFVKNKPNVTNPSIVKDYVIPSNKSKGFDLFFKQEGGKNVKLFINSITESVYNGFNITIKDSTEYNKSLGVNTIHKITVRFEIDLLSAFRT